MRTNHRLRTLLLALGTVTPGFARAADPPAPVASAPPPDRRINITIDFELGVECTDRTPATTPPAPPPAPSPVPTVVPAVAPPLAPVPQSVIVPAAYVPTPESVPVGPPAPLPAGPAALPDSLTGLPPLSLTELEQMVITGRRPESPADAEGNLRGFVDELVPAPAGPRSGRTGTAPLITAVEARALAQKYRTLTEVRTRYYQLLAVQRSLALHEELLLAAEKSVSATEALVQAGRAGRPDLLQARIEARAQAAMLPGALASYQSGWRRLAELVGQPDLPQAPLAGDLEQAPPVPDFDAAWEHVLQAHPELRLARAEVDRRRLALESDLRGPEGTVAQALARVNGWVPGLGHRQQERRAAWEGLLQAQAESGRLVQVLRRRFTDAYERYRAALLRAEGRRTKDLPEAREAYGLCLEEYRQGKTTLPQVVFALNNYRRISGEYVEALAELRQAEVAILGLLALNEPTEPPAAKGVPAPARPAGDSPGQPAHPGP